MATRLPELERVRSRIMAKTAEIRGRVGARGGFSAQRIGGGQLVNRARAKADQIMRRVRERKPGIIPMVKEFKPGERIRKIVPTGGVLRGDLTSRPPPPTGSGREFSIGDEPAYPYNKREIVVEA